MYDEPTLYRSISYKIIIHNYFIIYQRLLNLVRRRPKFIETYYIQTRSKEYLKTFINIVLVSLLSTIHIENRGYKVRGNYALGERF